MAMALSRTRRLTSMPRMPKDSALRQQRPPGRRILRQDSQLERVPGGIRELRARVAAAHS